MPQASDELRKIVHWIVQTKPADAIPSDDEVCKFLNERGYKLTEEWNWKLPSKDHYITEMELLCLNYLVDEWDYGWIEPQTEMEG